MVARRRQATKARTQLFIEKVEQRYSVGVVAATVAADRRPAARRVPSCIPGVAAARHDVHDRRLAVRRRPGHHAAAACRRSPTPGPARRARQVRGRHGAASPAPASSRCDKTGTLTEGTPQLAAIRVLPAAGVGEQGHPGAGRGRGEPVRAPAGPLGRRRGAGRRHHPGPGHRIHGAARPRNHRGRRRAHDTRSAAPAHLSCQADRAVDEAVAALEERGQTAAVMRIDGKPAAVLGIADRAGRRPPPRPPRSPS